MLDERNVCANARHPLVYVFERLKVGQLHHQEECLLEGIANRLGFGKQNPKAVLNNLRHRQGVKYRARNLYWAPSQASACGIITHQVLRKKGVQILKGKRVESNFVDILDQHLESSLVV